MKAATKFKAIQLPVLLLLLCLLSIGAIAQPLHLQYGRKKETIEFKMVKNLMIIPLFINGKGPYNFVLDTGVGIFLITDSSLVDKLDIPTLRTIKISGLGEKEELTAYVTSPLKIDIGNQISGQFPAAILKKDAFDLSGYAGMPVHGLIGYEFFSCFIVRVNYAASLLTAYKPDSRYKLRKSEVISLSIEDHKPYLVSEIVLSSGRTVSAKLIIDTGAGHPVSLETDMGEPFEIPEANIPGNLGVGLAGPINGYIGRIQSISLGKYKLKNVISAFPDYHDVASKAYTTSRNGNIGNNILKRFIVVFDYNNEKMYLRSSFNFKEPFEHDMTGLELSAAGKEYDRIFISRVEPGSSGDAAGLQKEDEILSINFKPVSTMNMQEINNLFHSRHDRSFVLDVIAKGSTRKEHIVITLKRRI